MSAGAGEFPRELLLHCCGSVLVLQNHDGDLRLWRGFSICPAWRLLSGGASRYLLGPSEQNNAGPFPAP